jgi:hypothetical protein
MTEREVESQRLKDKPPVEKQNNTTAYKKERKKVK